MSKLGKKHPHGGAGVGKFLMAAAEPALQPCSFYSSFHFPETAVLLNPVFISFGFVAFRELLW